MRKQQNINTVERQLQQLRNVGVMAHVDAGKTTLTERLLYYTGQIHKMGNVDDGNTTMDTNPQEGARGITISSAAITTYWKNQQTAHEYQINIIDTPGHVDFIAEVERSLRVLDGAVALFCSVSGVQPQSENVWNQANQYGVPRICFVNKMDRMGADFQNVLRQIRTKLNANAVAIQIPIGAGDEFEGVIDLISMKALYWDQNSQGAQWGIEDIPLDYQELAFRMRSELLDQIADQDELLLTKYFNDPVTILEEDLYRALRRGTLDCSIFPVMCGTAFKYIGVQPLLDAICQYLPGPTEKGSIPSYLDNEEVEIDLHNEERFSGLVFKIQTESYAGKIAMVRVYSGCITSGMSAHNYRTNKKVRIGRLLRIRSDKMEAVEQVRAGDICAIVGSKDLKTGDTLSELGWPIELEQISFSDPVIGYSIEPKSSADEQRMANALANLLDEDPTIKVGTDQITGQTILKGMGELHVEVTIEKMRQEFGLNLNIGSPRIAYRELFGQTTEHHIRLSKQNGGVGSFAEIRFMLGASCNPDSEQFEFNNQIKGGVLTREFVEAVEKGFRNAMKTGVKAGYPMQNMTVTLLDGSYHENDSSARDFEHAAEQGFKEAGKLCSPVLLEPLMKVTVSTPEDYIGVINSDISRKRGVILEIQVNSGRSVIVAEVPLSELHQYIGTLRSLTSGRASASMQLSRYAPVDDQFVC